MPSNPTPDAGPLTAAIADIIDLNSVRAAFPGYVVVDTVDGSAINGRILASADDSDLIGFSIAVAVS